MQKTATKVFIYASLMFGVLGILAVLTNSWGPDQPDTALSLVCMRLLVIDIFVILPAFALSVAGKYLNGEF